MYLWCCIVYCFTAIALVNGRAIGGPNGTVPVEDTSNVPCDDIGLYTFEYFFAHTCKRPPPTTCLFYTKGLSNQANSLAEQHEGTYTTIWKMWPDSWFNKKQVKSNRLRCIMQNKKNRKKYFQGMSGAMATQCDISATVMDPTPASPRMDGIFGEIEFPTLEEGNNKILHPTYGGKVNTIESINPQLTNVVTFWKRPGTMKRIFGGFFPNTTSLPETDDPCGTTIENFESFDEGGAYAVDW